MNGRNRHARVSVVVPAHNEEGNIEPLCEEFAKVFNTLPYSVEVVFVNDGSTDRTEQKMYEASRRFNWVRVMRNRTRLGLTTALARGFAQARGDILVFYPADLQFHPRDVPKMVEAIDNGADMVCGKKVGSYGKWLVSGIYNLMTRLLFPKLKVTDMNSVKAFTREVYNEFPTLREGWHRYLAVFAAAKDFIVREVPVTLSKRHSGKSKFAGKSRIMKGLTDLIAVKFQVSVFGDPMNLFGKTAFFFFFVGLVFAVIAFYDRFILERGYRPLLYGVIFFELAALVTFIMGIITEALVYLRDSLSDVKTQNKRLIEELGQRGGRGRFERSESEDEREDRIERFERERGERLDRGRGDRGDRSDRGDRRDRGDRNERHDRRSRDNRSEVRESREITADRPERSERTERPERGERGDRPERGERRERSDRGGRDDRRGRGRRDRGDRSERSDRSERPEQPRIDLRPEVAAVAPPEPVEPVETALDLQPAGNELFAAEPTSTDMALESPSAETSSEHPARRTGRRMRRMRPQIPHRSQPATESTAPAVAETPSGGNGQADLLDRPLTLRVRELPRETAASETPEPPAGEPSDSGENV